MSSSSSKNRKATATGTERARAAASAQIQERIDQLDAAPPTRAEAERLAAKAAATVFGPEVLGPPPEAPTTTAPAGPDAGAAAKGKRGGKRPAGGTTAPGAKPAAGKAAAPKTAKAPTAPKTPKPPKERKPKRVSLLDCAAQVLAASKEPMSAKEIVADVLNRKLWSTKGETPEATLYAAMIREIAAKKGAGGSRFKKVDRGMFVATGK